MGDNQPGDKGNVIKTKWRDEEVVYDLNNLSDDQKAEITTRIQLGWGYEKGQQELKETKNQLDYFNRLIANANQSEEGMDLLVTTLEKYIGKPLTKKQKEDLVSDDTNVSNKVTEEIQRKLDRLEMALLNKQINDEHASLKAKYSDYDPKVVEEFANKRGIMNFEDAYFIMNKEKILSDKEKEILDKAKKQQEKIDKVKSPDDVGGGEINIKKPLKKDYDEIAKDVIKDMKEQGKSLFIES